jgi:predicted acetyltransferase
MTDRPPYGPPLDEAEFERLVDITLKAFGAPASEKPAYCERVHRDGQRVLREKGGVTAGLVLLPMAQWFGGRAVPMTGLGDVIVAPEDWGRGSATTLLRSALRELRDARVALSTLFPATRRLYRGVGYEPAGSAYDVRLAAANIEVVERDLDVRPIEPSDEGAVAEAHRAYARRHPGHLDREPRFWRRVRVPQGKEADGYLVEVDGKVEGYLYGTVKGGPEWPKHLQLSDLVTLTPRAARRILTFLRDHRAQFETIMFRGSPNDPMLTLLPEQCFRIQFNEHWMLRIVDVEAALEARGYPDGVSAEIHLAIRDPIIPENDDRFLLELADGRARVARGGEGRIALDVRGLAPLYSGHLGPEALRSAGLLEGDDRDIRAAEPVFAGPAPWMIDHF